MLILFFVLWAVMFGLVLFMIAATPTTVRTSNAELIAPLLVTGVIAALGTLVVAGVISLF